MSSPTPSAEQWIQACAPSDIDLEDVLRFDFAGRSYAVYHTKTGYYATADLCTHGGARLSDGMVLGDIIECPLHQGRFHIPTGHAKSPPACRNLRIFPVRIEGGALYIGLHNPTVAPA